MIKDMQLIGKGKAKDLYKTADGKLLLVFTDRVTAFDGLKKARVKSKGEINCRLSEYWFNLLTDEGIPNHFIKCPTPNTMLVQNLKIIPVEVIWRNYIAGSLWRRYLKHEVEIPEIRSNATLYEGAQIPGGMIEFTTKFEEVDRLLTPDEIISNKWLTEKEIAYITELTRKINEIMSKKLLEKGIILADFKVEYGKNKYGEILLADEVGTPDGCRFWDKTKFEKGEIVSLDKDVFRKNKGDLSVTYMELYERIMT